MGTDTELSLQGTQTKGREEIIYEKREVMYDMRRVKIESMEDMESLPEGGWVEAPVGLHAKFV